MGSENGHEITDLLLRWNCGNKEVIDQLMPLVEQELRLLAHNHMRREPNGHTLQSTALINELYLRLVDRRRVEWQSRAQFFAFASHTMRRILVDHARARRADKRGGGRQMLTLDEAIGVSGSREVDLLALNDAMTDLARLDEELVRLVEMRFFSGLQFHEIACVLEVSPATVSRQWTTAKTWLFRQLKRP